MKMLKTLLVLLFSCGILFSQTSLQSGHFSIAAQQSSAGEISLKGSAGQIGVDYSHGENINLQSGFWIYFPTTVTDIDKLQLSNPFKFELHQNYPNPFNPNTMIEYQLAKEGMIDLSIYNLLGQKVATLISTSQSAGAHKINWDARSFSSGTYFYVIKTSENRQVKRMLLIK